MRSRIHPLDPTDALEAFKSDPSVGRIHAERFVPMGWTPGYRRETVTWTSTGCQACTNGSWWNDENLDHEQCPKCDGNGHVWTKEQP